MIYKQTHPLNHTYCAVTLQSLWQLPHLIIHLSEMTIQCLVRIFWCRGGFWVITVVGIIGRVESLALALSRDKVAQQPTILGGLTGSHSGVRYCAIKDALNKVMMFLLHREKRKVNNGEMAGLKA